MHEKDYKMIEAMEKFGGSFVKALSQAFLHADPTNYQKLRHTFPEYVHEYTATARKIDEVNQTK